MLEEAERRREAELKTKSRMFLVFIGLPVMALVIGAAGIAIKYQATAKLAVVRPVPIQSVEAPRVPPVGSGEVADLDSFRPKTMRAENPKPPAASSKQGWQMVDKGDISFAMQLLNFMQPPAKKEDVKH
ncbi:MAG: hypothetical protein RLZZ214_953 [Verrucomicrobiota bacterium]|jgi:hypothetical protein